MPCDVMEVKLLMLAKPGLISTLAFQSPPILSPVSLLVEYLQQETLKLTVPR